MLGQCFAPITLREFHERQGCLKGSGHDCSLCSLVCGAFLGKLHGKSGGCTHRSRYSSRVGAALQLEASCEQLAQALAAHTSDNWFQHPERVFWTVKTLLSNL